MTNILYPIITLTGLGAVFGAALAIAAKKLCVATDSRIEEIFAKLPGANCGACGLPGCMAFAEGLIKGTCTIERCAASSQETRGQIAEVLGVEAGKKIKTSSVLHCHGGSKRVKDKFIYEGKKDCVAANFVMGGPKECFFGCIGCGSCSRVCPVDAITMNDEDLPVINEDKCISCGKCVQVCPKKLFSVQDVRKIYAVRCLSQDMGKKVLDVCSVGCITCRRCEKACPVKAISIVNNLAVIDYNVCDNRGECFKACPTKAIAKKEDKAWVTQ